MQNTLLDHYRGFCPFTDPDLYAGSLRSDIPDDVAGFGRLVMQQIIHKKTLQFARVGRALQVSNRNHQALRRPPPVDA